MIAVRKLFFSFKENFSETWWSCDGRFELALHVFLARGVVLEMPQVPNTDFIGSPMTGNLAPEDLIFCACSADKDRKLETTLDKVTSR